MKKFKKIISMGCAAIMAISSMSMSAFAKNENELLDGGYFAYDSMILEENSDSTELLDGGYYVVETRASSTLPTQYLSLATPFIDTFWNNTYIAYSDFYFSPSSSGRIYIRSTSAKLNNASARIKVEVIDKESQYVYKYGYFTNNGNGNYSINSYASGLGSNNVYLRFTIEGGSSSTVLTGEYTASWN